MSILEVVLTSLLLVWTPGLALMAYLVSPRPSRLLEELFNDPDHQL